MLRAPQPAGGFSIVEVMITIGIIAMLMVLVAPSTSIWIQNSRLRNAAESVSSGVQFARIEALKRNTLVTFQMLDPATTAWQVCIYDPVTDVCSTAAGSVLATLSTSEAPANVTFGTDTTLSNTSTALAAGAGVPSSVTFDSFGRLATAALSNVMRVDVRNASLAAADERRLVILISLGGQVRMCDPKLSKATNPQGCA